MKHRTQLAVVVFACATVGAACSSGGNSIQGTVSGTSIAPADAVFFDDAAAAGTRVSIVSVSGICGYLSKGEVPKNLQILDLVLSPAVTSPGTYSVGLAGGGNLSVMGEWWIYDASCAPTTSAPATAGTATVSAVSSTSMSGTFDLTFGTDHVTGTFDASFCQPSFVNGVPTCT